MLLARLAAAPTARCSRRTALRLATAGGAEVLGRADLGRSSRRPPTSWRCELDHLEYAGRPVGSGCGARVLRPGEDRPLLGAWASSGVTVS